MMGPAFYVMAILGCGEADTACQQVGVTQAQYESADACTAATSLSPPPARRSAGRSISAHSPRPSWTGWPGTWACPRPAGITHPGTGSTPGGSPSEIRREQRPERAQGRPLGRPWRGRAGGRGLACRACRTPREPGSRCTTARGGRGRQPRAAAEMRRARIGSPPRKRPKSSDSSSADA